MAYLWEGEYIIIPGARVKFTATKASRPTLGATGIVLAIGESDAGIPYTEGLGDALYVFDDAKAAKDVLRGGTVARGMEFLFEPAPQEPGADKVLYLRAQAATRGEIDLGSLILQSKDFGQYVNGIQVKTEDAGKLRSANMGRKITVEFEDKTEVKDNLGPLFILKYTGIGATCTAAVTLAGSTKTLVVNSADNTEDLSLALDAKNYETIDKLVAFLNSKAYLECEYYDKSGVPRVEALASNDVVPVFSAKSIKTHDGTNTSAAGAVLTDTGAAFTAAVIGMHLYIASGDAAGNWYEIDGQMPTTLTCTGDDLVADGVAAAGGDDYEVALLIFGYPYLEKQWADEVSQYVEGQEVVTPGTICNATPLTALTGGTSPAMTADDLEATLEMAENVFCNRIWLATTDASFWQLGKVHVSTGRPAMMPANLYIGAAVGDDEPDDLAAYALAFNNDRCVLCGPGFKWWKEDLTGKETLGGIYMAAVMCGRKSGIGISDPLTHKVLALGFGLEREYTPTEQEVLISGGVAYAVTNVIGEAWVGKGVTSVQRNTQPWNLDASTPEISLSEAKNYIQQTVIMDVELNIIGKNARVTTQMLQGRIERILDLLKGAGIIYDDTISNIPAWKFISISRVADAWFPRYETLITGATNYVLTTFDIVG